MRDEPGIFTAWITEGALKTRGVRVYKGCVLADEPDWLRSPPHHGRHGYVIRGEAKNWHRTRDGAIAKAKEMRDAKIASLERQIAKLRAMTFDDTPQDPG